MIDKYADIVPRVIRMFWERLKPGAPDECWEWNGSRDADGYGQMALHGQAPYKAHRLSFALHGGRSPGKLNVCHSCDNRLCCNPAHLWLGTQAENMADMVSKGRQTRGSDVANSKLTADQVLMIYGDGRPYPKVAADYGVSVTLVCAIKRGRRWKYLTAA